VNPPNDNASNAAQKRALRKELIAAVDVVDDANTRLRTELEDLAAATARYRAHLVDGGDAGDFSLLGDVAARRRRVHDALAEFEETRQVTQRALFRLAAHEGESITAMAKRLGVSRQLVSRILHS
jgi:DNA-directed RNA polymerase specialized sigma24 family protein